MTNESGDSVQAEPKDETTIRASVTRDEHDVIKRTANLKLGMTIDEFVRTAVDNQLQASVGKPLAVLAKESAQRVKYTQMELF